MPHHASTSPDLPAPLPGHGPAFAQPKTGQARLDSLLAELPRAKPDTNRVKLLNDISNAYREQQLQ